MSKAVLVLDEMPESCFYVARGRRHWICPVNHNCEARQRNFERPDDCPLKPMPERMEAVTLDKLDGKTAYPTFVENLYKRSGWNACLDAIEGIKEGT